MLVTGLLYFCLAYLPRHVLCDVVSGYVFTEPISGDNLDDDFSETYHVGETRIISWLGNTLISSPADLWLTHFDSGDFSMQLLGIEPPSRIDDN
jgi:hypothetical protein